MRIKSCEQTERSRRPLFRRYLTANGLMRPPNGTPLMGKQLKEHLVVARVVAGNDNRVLEEMMAQGATCRRTPRICFYAGQLRSRNANLLPAGAQDTARGAELSGHIGGFLLVIIVFAMAAGTASADSAAETASRWGLIGRWSLDCSLPPDHDRGAVLAYEIADDGRLVYLRDFGDSTDSADVIAAEVSADNLLNLRVFFPGLKQTRDYGLKMEPDGTIRAFYNRDQNGRYSIRNGLFSANGKPTPPNHKCGSGTRIMLPSPPGRAA